MKLPTLDMTFYVLRAKGGCEHLAQDELRKGGYFGYVPTYKKLRRVGPHRERSLEPAPLMPGYIFVAGPIDWGLLHGDVDNREREPVDVLGKVYMVPKGICPKPQFDHVGKPLMDANGPAIIPSKIVVEIHVGEVDGAYDDKMPKAREQRRNRIRDLKELFAALEAADREKMAA